MRQGAAEPIAALNRVRIEETGEPLVDIRDACPSVDVREDCCPYLRRTVAEMVNRAQASLGPGLRLRVTTALRTLAKQRAHWDTYFAQLRERHPEWPLSALRRATNRYFAPYDQKAPPGHCTGGAVDVQLLGESGEPLDMVSPLEHWAAAYTWTDRISPEARTNRMLMVNAMLGAGFSNCREEFWHYSYGDSAWAVRCGLAACPYGLVEPPPCVESRFADAAASGISQIGPTVWAVTPATSEAGQPALLVGIFWSEGREVHLHVLGGRAQAYEISADRETWRGVDHEPRGADAALRMVPEQERVYLRMAPALPPEARKVHGAQAQK